MARPVHFENRDHTPEVGQQATERAGHAAFITDPEATELVNRMPLGRSLTEPGSYVMRYVTVTEESWQKANSSSRADLKLTHYRRSD